LSKKPTRFKGRTFSLVNDLEMCHKQSRQDQC
jgi:hypothetical protein